MTNNAKYQLRTSTKQKSPPQQACVTPIVLYLFFSLLAPFAYHKMI